ncbi:hypothetical protein AB0O39_30910 [Streptomyces anulatus]|uniref:hypothetical protein n=1 Tax=Streptomyces anulatus TaxID=1892 RepID=UPI00342A4AA0
MADGDGTPAPAGNPHALAALVAREAGAEVEAVHDDHRRNEAEPEQICHLVRQAGLATILLRRPEALTPAELLTARYAASHGHPAWRYCLVPMDDARLVRAVDEDRTATAEHLRAALTLAAALPGIPGAVTSQLRARLRRCG